MGTQIKADALSTAAAREAIQRGVDAYCSFRLTPLSAAIPIAGSGDHDGRLQDSLTRALASYRALMLGDAAALDEAYEALARVDARMAAVLERR